MMQDGPWTKYASPQQAPQAPAEAQMPWERYQAAPAAAPRPARQPRPQAARPAAPAAPQTLGDSGLTRDEIYAAQRAQGYDDAEIAAGIEEMFGPQDGSPAQPVDPLADLNIHRPENVYADSYAAMNERHAQPYDGPGSSEANPFILRENDNSPEYRDALQSLSRGMYVQTPEGVHRLSGDPYINANVDPNDARVGQAVLREENLADQSRAFAMAAAEQIPFLDEAAVGAAGLISGRGYSDVRDSWDAVEGIDNQVNRGQRIAGGLTGAAGMMVAPGVGQAGNFIRAGAGGLNQTARAALVGGGAGGLFGAANTDGGLEERATGGLIGAGVGAATGGLFDAGGQGLIAGATRRAAAGPSPARRLSRQGVDLTPGQAAGGVLRRVEDGLTSVPILGDAIRGAQRRGLGTFDNVATNTALEPIGVNIADSAGRQGVRAADDAISAAYTRALDGTTVALDDTARAALANVRRVEGLTPDMSRNLNAILDNTLARLDTPAAGGDIGGMAPRTIREIEEAAQAAGVSLSVQEGRGGLTLSKIVVPQSQRGEGVGSAVMQQLIDYADQSGQRLLLTPDGSFGGSVPRLRRFYAQFGFTPNTGRSRDLSVSEAMIREPQAPRTSPAPPPSNASAPVDGQTWKQIDSELAAAIRAADRGAASAPEQRILRDRLQEARAAVGGAMERADPMAFADVRAADRASAQYRLVRKASSDVASAGRGGDASPATLNRAVVAAGGERQAARGESLLQDLTDDAMQVLPSTVPDSGTALRGLLSIGGLGGTGAAITVAPVQTAAVLGGLGLLSTAYGPTGQRIFNAIYRSTDRQAANSALGELARMASQNPALQGQYEAASRHVLESFGRPSPERAPEARGLLNPSGR